MSLTLGLTGMDPATEAALKAAFLEANARLGQRWALVPDAEASHVVVDMDSMYGPMSWLRLHAAGRQVIGLTSAPRTQTDYRLGRPFDVEQLAGLLVDVARGAGVELQAADAAAGSPASASEPAAATRTDEAPAASAPVEEAAPVQAAVVSAQVETRGTAVELEGPDTTASARPADESADNSPPAAAAADIARIPGLASWLGQGALSRRVRFRHAGGTTLFIDPAADAWHGPTALKSIAACFEHPVTADDFEALDDATWLRETASAGAPQPLPRLRWLGGLLAGKGELLPGYDASDRFQLNKWSQTEREYPRHFRIATQMMKGPATLAEIAEASGVPGPDVADFINANLATGFAEPVVEAPPVVEEPVKARGGLLGRLRSR
ncbi:hypothetical protein [Luteimonas sp. MC1750]|uniref:hypothetical protein n=1 Tax=Luteimonas sp. MC1750 TaxID=2799326 RepID=UPI0018F0A714|nr:hypothetical protein [Luteimonas sp. MC1750]MBJ6983088.1 hypothetical protein [Luteimonas sp. MC1750]QQO05199.1 hypothetical protein JGR68_10105 [Luteimonas sp. MC1750]